MKNTVLSNFRFNSEIVLYDFYTESCEWSHDFRYFKVPAFELALFKKNSASGFVHWEATLAEPGAFTWRHSSYAPTHCSKTRKVHFIIPNDRAALRLIRMLERHDTGEYLKSVCKTTSDIPYHLKNEFNYMIQKVERFCQSIGGSRV